MVRLTAHYNGKVIVPDEAVQLPEGVLCRVKSVLLGFGSLFSTTTHRAVIGPAQGSESAIGRSPRSHY